MIEPEMAFADLEDNMEIAEQMIKYIIGYVLEHAPEEMKFFNQFVDKEAFGAAASRSGIRVWQSDLYRSCKNTGTANDQFQYKVSWGIDLQTEHERFLTEKVFKKPVFVTDYPKDIKHLYENER